ncbi:helix-turn-helix domain-containing protein [Streptomyces sp. Tu102]|uniref:PucR family transcriptional regulator n=1 Tax=Streptomyces sp. Tu102 TaxID=2838019 RepID=UPI001BDC31BF|nr:helix-turn-helix domain-containing protein [Streptomyces sp. Tu102]MBT1098059.1 helix-turn-helix domain-containing protein [Streptomyces sp. Tu102]
MEGTDADLDAILTTAVEEWDTSALLARVEDDKQVLASPLNPTEPGLRALMRSSLDNNFRWAKEYVSHGRPLPEDAYFIPREWARTLAEMGVSADALLSTVRASSMTAWNDLYASVDAALSRSGLPADTQRAVLTACFDRTLRFWNELLGEVSYAHQHQVDRMRRSGAQARSEAVRSVLDSEGPVDGKDLYPVLRYDLTSEHVAVLLANVSEDGVQQVSNRLKSVTAASATLLVREGVEASILWLSHQEWSSTRLEAIARELESAGVVAMVSEASSGLEGFRATYRQVIRIAAVRRHLGTARKVVVFGDVRLEALLLDNPDEAKRFAAAELGALDSASAADARLRETLLAWYEGGSLVTAANRLHLHEHTVRNRLQRIEEALGHPLAERRLELHLALRLHRLWAD